MAQTIRLGTREDERQRQLGGLEAVTNLLEDFRRKETARQDKQQILDFVKFTSQGISPEEAAGRVVSSEPSFDKGLAGIFQRLGAGGADPSSVLNIALKSQLNKPSEIDIREQEADIEATKALAEQRRAPKKEPSDIITFRDKTGKTQKRRVSRERQNEAFEQIITEGGSFAKPKTEDDKNKQISFWQTQLRKTLDDFGTVIPGSEKLNQRAAKEVSRLLKETEIKKDEDLLPAFQKIKTKIPGVKINPKTGRPQLKFDLKTKLVTSVGGQKLDTPLEKELADQFGELLILSKTGKLSQEEMDAADRILEKDPERITEVLEALK